MNNEQFELMTDKLDALWNEFREAAMRPINEGLKKLQIEFEKLEREEKKPEPTPFEKWFFGPHPFTMHGSPDSYGRAWDAALKWKEEQDGKAPCYACQTVIGPGKHSYCPFCGRRY